MTISGGNAYVNEKCPFLSQCVHTPDSSHIREYRGIFLFLWKAKRSNYVRLHLRPIGEKTSGWRLHSLPKNRAATEKLIQKLMQLIQISFDVDQKYRFHCQLCPVKDLLRKCQQYIAQCTCVGSNLNQIWAQRRPRDRFEPTPWLVLGAGPIPSMIFCLSQTDKRKHSTDASCGS